MPLPIIEPIRSKLTRVVPRGREWIYEVKLDGFGGMLYVEGGRGRFRSKTNKPLARFGELAGALARQLDVEHAIFDGEVLVLSDGRPDFAALLHNRAAPEYAAFDLLWLNGRDLRAVPL